MSWVQRTEDYERWYEQNIPAFRERVRKESLLRSQPWYGRTDLRDVPSDIRKIMGEKAKEATRETGVRFKPVCDVVSGEQHYSIAADRTDKPLPYHEWWLGCGGVLYA